MTDYKAWEEKIWLYLDGRLPESEKGVLLQSLEMNDELQKMFASCQSLHSILQDDKPEQPSASFVSGVMDKIDSRSLVIASRPDWKKAGWFFLAGAISILLINIYLVVTGQGSSGNQYPFMTDLVSKLTEYSLFGNLAWISSGIFLLMMLYHFLGVQKRHRSIKPV